MTSALHRNRNCHTQCCKGSVPFTYATPHASRNSLGNYFFFLGLLQHNHQKLLRRFLQDLSISLFIVYILLLHKENSCSNCYNGFNKIFFNHSSSYAYRMYSSVPAFLLKILQEFLKGFYQEFNSKSCKFFSGVSQ